MVKSYYPFIKWAGGKAQLLEEIQKRYVEKRKFCEPFLGGGAVFFNYYNLIKPKEILLNDLNKQLIITYDFIKNNIDTLIDDLTHLEKNFIPLDIENRKKFFYDRREEYNEAIKSDKETIPSLFIFLNKTCFNGLYRVNSKGEFNVPIGSYKNPKICDADNLKIVSEVLQNVTLNNGSYTSCFDFIDSDTFVYIDPPYRPLIKGSFIGYTSGTFNDESQKELKEFIDRSSSKGARILLSNSDPKNTNKDDNFFDELYSNYRIERVYAKRMINSKVEGRDKISELLILN